jgi:flavodoxin
MKTIVVYYSGKGSNKYLAGKIAERLNCDMEQIKPRLNIPLLTIFGVYAGNRKLKAKIVAYDRILLCGPVFMGKFIAPLKSFVMNYEKQIRKLIFITCCGSTYEKKFDKFGHGHVFAQVENLLKEKCILCEALPIVLVLPDDKKEDHESFMKTHLNEDNFKGEIKERFDYFIGRVENL